MDEKALSDMQQSLQSDLFTTQQVSTFGIQHRQHLKSKLDKYGPIKIIINRRLITRAVIVKMWLQAGESVKITLIIFTWQYPSPVLLCSPTSLLLQVYRHSKLQLNLLLKLLTLPLASSQNPPSPPLSKPKHLSATQSKLTSAAL